jgi:hypothetical protein
MRTNRLGVTILALATLLGTAAVAGAQNQCLVGFQDGSGADVANGAQLCAQASGKTCSVSLKVCLNRTEEGCITSGTIIKKKTKVKGSCGGAGKVKVTPGGSSETCGNLATVTVKTKKKGKLPGTCRLTAMTKTKDGRTDSDTITITCNPAAGPTCPTTSTTTTSTTTTTTTPTLCSCCPGAGSLIRFTNGIGSGNCGTVKDATNALLFNLQCGGLYTGAGASTLSNPAAPPDMGTEYIKPSACSGSTYTILPTVPADLGGVGGNHRNCTSAGVTDPDYPACAGGTNVGKPCVTNADCPTSTCSSTMPGCLFGAPLAIPNPGFTGASVCVVNRVQTSASGNGDCQTGDTTLNLPLSSDLYLTGDLLDGSAPDRPDIPGINPCPICDPGTLLCEGGPRHGLSCHPDTSVLNAAYPTSHDCPPPPGPLGANYIGALPIPFNLTTGTQTSTANNTGLAGQEVFCGFCGSAFGPTFHNPPVACANDAACTGVTGCPGTVACNRCKQRDSGAFNLGPAPGTEHVLSITGASAGACLADGAPHAATLASAFCIPPAYNATVDANGDLPGPGVVSLPGNSQLIP